MANTTDCPGTLNCPALPRVSLDQAVIDLLESIALQESALSHILCAESQKMKTAMGMEELDPVSYTHLDVYKRQEQNPADVETLMNCKMGDETVDQALKELILVIKENIKVRRFTRYEGVCSAYVHGGGTHGILVNFETTNDIDAKDEFVAYGKDIAMQVAAANPGYVDEASVPAEVVAKEKEIMLAQMAQDPKTANKPEAVKVKMIEGKIKKFFKENCLVDQEFVKDGDLTVAQYTAKVAKDLGGEIKIVKFARFVKGEGLEKRADDFASEVASMVK